MLTIEAPPRFRPVSHIPAADWPTNRAWIGAARHNGLSIIPERSYTEPLVEHKVLGRRIITVGCFATAKAILANRGDIFGLTNMHRRMLRPALGNGIIVAEGESWKRQRQASAAYVKTARVLRDSSAERIEALIDRWLTSESPNPISNDLSSLALNLLAAECFGYEGAVASDRLLDHSQRHRDLIERVDVLDVVGAPIWLRTPRMSAAHQIVRRYYSAIDAAITEHGSLGFTNTFSKASQRDFVINLMVGFESVSAACMWVVALVAQHPELWAWMTANPAEQRKRLTAILMETLRLYPPLPFIFRRARRTFSTAHGQIPAGAIVCVSPYIIHRNSLNWSDPNVFDATRFAKPSPDMAFMAFGAGARQCVGQRIGFFLCEETLSRIFARGRPRLTNGPLSAPRAGVSLRPEKAPEVTFEPVIA